MAPTTYMIARALGAPFIALPIFLMRRFHHGGFVVRPDSGIKEPKDLEGNKVGVRAYSVTTGVWTRGIFVNEYGLDSSKVTWVVDDEEHVSTLKLPPNVVHAPDGKSLQSMMKTGEIQAGFTGPAGVGRAGPPISGWDKASEAAAAADTYPELIANVEQVEADWFRRSGIYPIHGLIVVKDEHIKRHPWLARSLMDAFVAAKRPYLAELKRGHGDSPEDKRYRSFLSLMSDPLPYGMAANRASIEALVTYSLQQKLIPSRPQLDQVFVEIDP
jgi:4,5-dihydroxyphthalate decarboxylase